MTTQRPTYVRPDAVGKEEPHPTRKPVTTKDISNSLIGAIRRAYRDAEPNRGERYRVVDFAEGNVEYEYRGGVDVDGCRRLKFVSGWYKSDNKDLQVALGFIGRYNAFDPERVAEFINQLPSDVYVALGREVSPVVYLWTDNPDTVLTGAKKLNPDELSVYFGAKEYPNPDDVDVTWVDDPDRIRYLKDGGNARYTRWLDTPVGRVRHPATGLRPSEKQSPALIRMWWD